jgi:hypothetical protein
MQVGVWVRGVSGVDAVWLWPDSWPRGTAVACTLGSIPAWHAILLEQLLTGRRPLQPRPSVRACLPACP